MKNYVKPMVLANEELAEGVYAAGSGETRCFTYNSTSGKTLSDSDGYYEYNVEFIHAVEAHMRCTHKIVIYFSGPVQDVKDVTNTKNGSVPEISGNTVTVVWQQENANGGGERANIGIKVLGVAGIKVEPTGGYGYVA